MSGISADLSLDASDAFSSLDEIDARFAEIIAGFGAGLADAIGSVSAEPVDVPVEADTAAAQDAISGLEADPILVEVEVDAEQAQTSIDQTQDSLDGLSTTATQTSGSLDSAGSAATAFGVSAGIARGNASGLLGPLQRLGPGGVAAAGGIGAAVAVTGELFAIGVRATSALERFDLILGESAGAVDRIDIGGLNTDIAGLASASASGGAGLRNAAADFFQFAETGGLAASQAEETTQQILVLAARASVLNPALGEAGDASAKLQRALATGGRFASQFGLSLDSVSIKAEAARLGLEGADGELSRAALVAGGASLAMQQVGGTLAEDIAAGSENAAVQLRSVGVELRSAAAAAGKPLVAPILDLLREASPFAVELGEAFGQLASGAVPLLTATLTVLTPVLGVVANTAQGLGIIFGAIPTPVYAVGAAFLAATVGVDALAIGLTFLAASPVGAAIVGVGLLAAALGALSTSGEEGAAGAQAALDEVTRSATSLAEVLNDEGQGGLADEVLSRLIEISPQVVAALTETYGSVANVIDLINSGQVPSDLFEPLIGQSGLTGDAADTTRTKLAELGYQISISANRAEVLTAAEEANAAASGDATANFQRQADAASELSDQASALADNLDAIFGAQQTVAEGAIDLRNQQRQLFEAFLEINGQYVAGSANGDMFLSTAQDLAAGIRDQTIAVLESSAGADGARLAQAGYIAGLRETLEAAGFTESQIRDLIRTFARVPEDQITEFETPGAREAEDAAQDVDHAVRSIPARKNSVIHVDNTQALYSIQQVIDAYNQVDANRAAALQDLSVPAGRPRAIAAGTVKSGGSVTVVESPVHIEIHGGADRATVEGAVRDGMADHRRKIAVQLAMRN